MGLVGVASANENLGRLPFPQNLRHNANRLRAHAGPSLNNHPIIYAVRVKVKECAPTAMEAAAEHFLFAE